MIIRLDVHDIYNIMLHAYDYIKQNKDYLTDLDAAIGDADHGINMERGFNFVTIQLKNINIENTDIGTILMSTANAMLATVGGAAGPLYGMFFMNMATVAFGKREIDLKTLVAMLEQGLKGIQDIGGGTQPGEKTMVDTLYPFIEELKQQLTNNNDIYAALDKALKAAEKGMLATINMMAKKGRASYLGERSVGHQDPGATSMYLILKAFYDIVKNKE
jgi:dihydroxyacetone kinase-like protein